MFRFLCDCECKGPGIPHERIDAIKRGMRQPPLPGGEVKAAGYKDPVDGDRGGSGPVRQFVFLAPEYCMRCC